jgi:transposase
VEAAGIDVFKTVARSAQTHYESIFNFFDNQSTNASAESFNAKIKAFRIASRGIGDITFFLFRRANIYVAQPYFRFGQHNIGQLILNKGYKP